jgi:hypothetical protein
MPPLRIQHPGSRLRLRRLIMVRRPQPERCTTRKRGTPRVWLPSSQAGYTPTADPPPSPTAYTGTGLRTPHRKPKGTDLSESAPEFNRDIASHCANVERVIAHLEKWKLLVTGYCGLLNLPSARVRLLRGKQGSHHRSETQHKGPAMPDGLVAQVSTWSGGKIEPGHPRRNIPGRWHASRLPLTRRTDGLEKIGSGHRRATPVNRQINDQTRDPRRSHVGHPIAGVSFRAAFDTARTWPEAAEPDWTNEDRPSTKQTSDQRAPQIQSGQPTDAFALVERHARECNRLRPDY